MVLFNITLAVPVSPLVLGSVNLLRDWVCCHQGECHPSCLTVTVGSEGKAYRIAKARLIPFKTNLPVGPLGISLFKG